MKTHLLLSLALAAALVLLPVSAASAHGEPVIAVEPTVVAAGGQITLAGTEMEPGEVFAITLEGLATSVPLGEATVTGEGEEAGFTATFTIPADTAPGSYTVRAATEEGESTSADLTVTAAAETASAEPATVQEPTGERHQIDRPRPLGQVIVAALVIALGAAVGFALVRVKG